MALNYKFMFRKMKIFVIFVGILLLGVALWRMGIAIYVTHVLKQADRVEYRPDTGSSPIVITDKKELAELFKNFLLFPCLAPYLGGSYSTYDYVTFYVNGRRINAYSSVNGFRVYDWKAKRLTAWRFYDPKEFHQFLIAQSKKP